MGFQLKKNYSIRDLPLRKEETVFWKRIFNLPTEPVWYITNIFLNYAVVFYTLAYSVNIECVESVHEGLDFTMYAIDIIYLIDVLANLAIIYIPSLNVEEWNPTYRPLSILIWEMISLIPFKSIRSWFTPEYYHVHCLMTLLRLLRLPRIVYFHLRFGRMLLMYNLRILEFPVKLSFWTFVSYSVLCNSTCWGLSNDECAKKCPFWVTILRILSKMVGYSLNDSDDDKSDNTWDYWSYYSGIFQYIAFVFIIAVTVANMTIGVKDSAYFSAIYMNMFRSLYKARVKYKLSQKLLDRTYNFFKVGWTNYGGLDTGDEFYSLLTPALSSEMMLDVSWPAFKHSNLLRTANIPYLRCLSLVMTQVFVMPGDYIYRKGDWKDKLMYLTDGTIDILSEEDGESAILSLGSGTCLGEAGIVLSYPSVNCVRAKTFCEFHVLDKRSFMATYRMYPESWKHIQERIMVRIEHSKKLHDIFELLSRRSFTEKRDIDTSTIYWMKNTLHKLMSNSIEMAYRHEFQNIFLVDEIDKRIFERLIFTASFLDMLVIKERVATDSDPIFVRTQFPFILQPHSVITVVWETVIILVTLMVIFLIPYASFLTTEYVPGYKPLILFITLIFFMDLVFQCSTAIKTPKVQYITCRSISVARLQSVAFWADILSCLPLELYTPTILTVITPSNQAMMHMNRIIKIWRIDNLFSQWSNQFDVNSLYITCAKLICTQIYLCYVLYAILVFIINPGENLDMKKKCIFDVIQMMTNVGLLTINTDNLYGYFLMATFISTSFKWILIAKTSALFVLSKIALLRVQNQAYLLTTFIKEHNLSDIYTRRLRNNYENNWELDYGRSSNIQPRFMSDLSTVNYTEVVDSIFGSTVRKMRFFRQLPNRSFLDLMKCMKFVTRPNNETIIYNGDILRRIQLFYMGSLDALDVDGNVIKTINSSQPINLVDILFGFPAMRTYVTRTTCTFVEIERTLFYRFLLKYPEVLNWINEVKKSLENERLAVIEEIEEEKIKGLTPSSLYQDISRQSFYLFGYNMKTDSFEEYDFYLPYDMYYPFDWIRYLLSRFTILPNGYFIYCWEGVRAFLAIINAIVHFVNVFNDPEYAPMFYALYGYGLLDVYLRLHVCYYDERGVLIKHPLKTARHYITHGFLLDAIALLPMRVNMNEDDTLTYFIGNSVRLLPLGRYYQFMQTLKFSVIKPESKILLLMYAPLIAVSLNYIGSFLLNLQCDFSKNAKFNPDLIGFNCEKDSFLIASGFHKPIHKIRAHFYGIYIAASFLMLYGFRGYTMIQSKTRLASSILSFVGQTITCVIIANTIFIYSIHKTFLSAQQSKMTRLKRYMKTMNVSKRLMKIVVDSYEVHWKITKGRTIYGVMGPFTTPLRRDFYYEIYGERLLSCSAFRNKSEIFYRNVLDYLSYSIIPKGGYLTTINDVEETTYIIYSGIADVLSPDGTRLTTIMEGAMFGNLERKKFVRISISIIAMSHIEIFAIKSLEFYKILEYFPKVLDEYQKLRKIYFTYIPSRQQEVQIAEYLTHEDIARRSEGIDLCEAYNPRGVKFKIWKFLVVAYTCFFAILLDLYHMASNDWSYKILILLYSSDILYIVYFLTLDRLAFEDTRGYLITDLVKIKKKMRENRLKTWLCIASIFPLDVIILSSKLDVQTRDDIYSFTRLNRALRLIHIGEYFSSNIDKVNVKFVIFKTSAVVCWTCLFIVAYATVFTILACRHSINIYPPIPSCRDINAMNSTNKFLFFARRVYLASHILAVSASSRFYPHAAALIMLFTCSFMLGALLNALVYGQIFSIYDDLSVPKKTFKRRLDRLFFFMDREDVSISLVTRVNRYVQLIWMTTSGEVYPRLLEQAPIYLKEAVMNSAFGQLICNHPVFVKCHPDCLRQIIRQVEVYYFFANDYIQFKGSIDDSMYFLFAGSVFVLAQDMMMKDEMICLNSGDSFGVKQGLFRQTPHEHSYKCKKYSIVIRLHLNRWEYLMQFFPASKQRIYDEIVKYEGL